jgi:hypothetical protein
MGTYTGPICATLTGVPHRIQKLELFGNSVPQFSQVRIVCLQEDSMESYQPTRGLARISA